LNEFNKYKFVAISDLHLPVKDEVKEVDEFLTFLEKISNQSENIILLGDIFEIWSSIEPFNHKNGKKLLKKIEMLSSNCNFFIVEGNYDFFICEKFGKYFKKCSSKFLTLSFNSQDFIFTHGHLFASFKDKVFISLLKSKLTLFAIEKELLNPVALKKEFEKTKYGRNFSNTELIAFAKKVSKKFKNRQIICGHFHTPFEKNNVIVVPDYLTTKSYLAFNGQHLQTLTIN
jgi:UDP-2,3-diacylglucosamine pyrophosphatase LpxH